MPNAVPTPAPNPPAAPKPPVPSVGAPPPPAMQPSAAPKPAPPTSMPKPLDPPKKASQSGPRPLQPSQSIGSPPVAGIFALGDKVTWTGTALKSKVVQSMIKGANIQKRFRKDLDAAGLKKIKKLAPMGRGPFHVVKVEADLLSGHQMLTVQAGKRYVKVSSAFMRKA